MPGVAIHGPTQREPFKEESMEKMSERLAYLGRYRRRSQEPDAIAARAAKGNGEETCRKGVKSHLKPHAAKEEAKGGGGGV